MSQNGQPKTKKHSKENLHGLARDLLKVEVGDGKSIHLWLDNYHPLGPLFDKFGFRPIYDSQSRIDAKLDSVLRNGEWCWKPARSDELVIIQSRLPKVRLGVADKPICTIARKWIFVSSDTWNHLRLKRQPVDWWSLIWFNQAIPKQAFLLWLVVPNRLTTGDRLLTWRYKGDTQCCFCRHGTESRDRLFFNCSFSSRIWKICMKRCNISNPLLD